MKRRNIWPFVVFIWVLATVVSVGISGPTATLEGFGTVLAPMLLFALYWYGFNWAPVIKAFKLNTIRGCYTAQRVLYILGIPIPTLGYIVTDGLYPGRHLGFWVAVGFGALETVLLLHLIHRTHTLEDAHIEGLNPDLKLSKEFGEAFFPTRIMEPDHPGPFHYGLMSWKPTLSRTYRRKVYVPQNHRNYRQRPSGKRQKRSSW